MQKMTALIAFVALSACQGNSGAPTQADEQSKSQSDEQEIAKFCNEIAAESVANPNSNAPLARLQKKILEEEWNFSDVDRICSAALSRKMELLYGR